MAAATGGWIPGEQQAQQRLNGARKLREQIIPVDRILATPCKVLCSALFVSNRDYGEALARSCFINDGICTLIVDNDLALVRDKK